jgi:hypothetical protein
MSRFRFIIIGLVLFLFSVNVVSARSSASIIAFDQITHPNQPVRLAIRLVTGGLSLVHRPISGERIEFILKDRSLGQTLSGGDGVAVKSFVPPTSGLYVVTVRLIESPRYEADSAELYVACRKSSVPILFVALSSLRTPVKPPSIPFNPTPSSDAMPEAVKVLSGLSKRFQLLYFETGDEALISETKDWLIRQSFPSAPLFVWSMPNGADRRTEEFVERLQEIRDAGWTNLSAGITRSTEDAEALSRLKIKAVVMTEEDENVSLEGSMKVMDWKSVPSVLK